MYADIVAMRRKIGKSIEHLSAQLAAIYESHSAKLTAHNIEDIEGCGVEIINP